MHNIFVYGSLRRGLQNHDLLGESPFMGNHTLKCGTMVSLGGFPAVLNDGTQKPVVAELYQVDDATLARLDRLEAHPTWYVRTPIISEQGLTGEVYLMPPRLAYANSPVVANGDWVEYVGRRNV